MPGLPVLQLPVALWLMSGPGSALPATPAELPGGGGAAFRARMMAWSEPAPPPPAPPVSQTRAPARLPRLSSRFGYRSDPILGARALHAGIDIPGPLGTPVRASGDGVVRFAGQAGGYGRMVEVDHGNGLRTRYAHLSAILVRPGMPVAQGETIARMGSSGRSTGSHLHFEVRADGRASDPLRYLGGEAPLPDSQASRPSAPHVSAFARAVAAAGKAGESGF
jgi:murein DD-endopeptidase MepM/ murein hydrolase activator NlpD